jgi:hypothetical protein
MHGRYAQNLNKNLKQKLPSGMNEIIIGSLRSKLKQKFKAKIALRYAEFYLVAVVRSKSFYHLIDGKVTNNI